MENNTNITATTRISTAFSSYDEQRKHAEKVSNGHHKQVKAGTGTDRFIPDWLRGRKSDPLSEEAQLILIIVRRSGDDGITKADLKARTNMNNDDLFSSFIRELNKMGFFNILPPI